MMDDIESVENLLFKFWQDMPEPKTNYTLWFYTYRKNVIQWLFSRMVEMPEEYQCKNAKRE